MHIATIDAMGVCMHACVCVEYTQVYTYNVQCRVQGGIQVCKGTPLFARMLKDLLGYYRLPVRTNTF